MAKIEPSGSTPTIIQFGHFSFNFLERPVNVPPEKTPSFETSFCDHAINKPVPAPATTISTFPLKYKRDISNYLQKNSSLSYRYMLQEFLRLLYRNVRLDCTDYDIDQEYVNWESSFSIDEQHQYGIPVHQMLH